jgi:hypothetical protein
VKLIIAGSRSIHASAVDTVGPKLAELGWTPTQIVSGGALGADQVGERWARMNGIPIRQFIPDWGGYAGMRAGHVRNSQMADYADALLALWDGESKGTAHMVKVATERRLKVHTLLIRSFAGRAAYHPV